MSHGPQNLSPRRDSFDSVRRLTRTTVAHFVRAAGTVIDSSHPVFGEQFGCHRHLCDLEPCGCLPQLIGPSVHSCVQHCPERVTVVAAVVFVPLSPVSSGSVLALYCLNPVMLRFTNKLCNWSLDCSDRAACSLAVLLGGATRTRHDDAIPSKRLPLCGFT